ncbi:MAG: DUF4199 domain-containing protein [Opitutaceae bacterium]
MKTSLIYGLYLALAGLVLNLILFFAGFHSLEKFGTGQWIGGVVGLILAVAFIALGTKARRDEIPATENFGYGRALGTGLMISVFSCLFGIVTNFLYTRVINPGFREVIIQAQSAKMDGKGVSAAQIERMETFMRSPLGAVLNVVFVIIGAMIVCTIISLITAAIFKRPAVVNQPPMAV